MALTTARDVPLLVRSENASSERRVSPAWTLAQLRTKLEPITGIPPSSQCLTLQLLPTGTGSTGGAGRLAATASAEAPPGSESVVLEAEDEDVTQLSHWPLTPYAQLQVCRPKFTCTRACVLQSCSLPKAILSLVGSCSCVVGTTVLRKAKDQSATSTN